MKPRILLVDDSDGVRDALAALLARRYDVATACDSAEALARLRSGDVAPVIVSDYSMPGGSGVELLARVRREWPQTVGILLTANVDPAVATAAVDGGQVFRLLSKPTSFDVLSHAIDSALRRHVELRESAAAEERLAPAEGSLERSSRLAVERSGRRVQLLSRLQRLSIDLACANTLQSIADLAAAAIYEILPRRGVLVQLWDAGGERSIESAAGPEMSDRMWRLSVGDDDQGEIVVDWRTVAGAPIGPEDEHALRSIAAAISAVTRSVLEHAARERAQRALIVELARLGQSRAGSGPRHLERIGAYCGLLARSLRDDGDLAEPLDEGWIRDMVDASALHDVGEVCVPDSILLKHGPLSAAEREIMKRHADAGATAIAAALHGHGAQRMLELARDICLGHHERWDGSGYPQGLRGASTPLAARMVGLADVYDALTTARPYRPAWTHSAAVEWIRSRSGSQLDPQLVASFLAREAQFDTLRVRLADAPPAVEWDAGEALERGR